MSDITDLCAIIHRGNWLNFDALAEEIIAAGFHRDRIITTAEELDALAPWAVIRDACEDVWEKWVDVYNVDIPVWVTPGVEERESGVFVPMLPVTVLHEGVRDE